MTVLASLPQRAPTGAAVRLDERYGQGWLLVLLLAASLSAMGATAMASGDPAGPGPASALQTSLAGAAPVPGDPAVLGRGEERVLSIPCDAKLSRGNRAVLGNARAAARVAESTPSFQNGSELGPTRRAALWWIRVFQKVVSPVDGPSCSFSPSCSTYGGQAIRKHGLWRGIPMTAERLMRDHRPHNPDRYPLVERDGDLYYQDPVEANDFWWSGGRVALLTASSPVQSQGVHSGFAAAGSREAARADRGPRRQGTFVGPGSTGSRGALGGGPEAVDSEPDSLAPAASPSALPEVTGPPRPGEAPPADGGPDAGGCHAGACRFALDLFDQGHWEEAALEFRRFCFLCPDHPRVPWFRLLLGECLERQGRIGEAIEEYRRVAADYPAAPDGEEALFRIGETLYRAAKFEEARIALHRVPEEFPSGQRQDDARYRLAWSALRLHSFAAATEEFGELNRTGGPWAGPARDLAAGIDGIKSLRSRSPLLAGLFSALLPGSGQIYTGSYKDALLAFAVNAALIAGSYEAFDKKIYAAGGMVSAVGLTFYLGNVYGAVNSAHRRNQEGLEAHLRPYRERWEWFSPGSAR